MPPRSALYWMPDTFQPAPVSPRCSAGSDRRAHGADLGRAAAEEQRVGGAAADLPLLQLLRFLRDEVVGGAGGVGPAGVVELLQVVHPAEDLGQAQAGGRGEAELAVVALMQRSPEALPPVGLRPFRNLRGSAVDPPRASAM